MIDLTADAYTLQGQTTFDNTFVPAIAYTDMMTGIEFEDFPGANDLSVTGMNSLTTVSGGSSDDSIVIVIPATILAIDLTVTVSKGLCANDCAENESSGFLGFINNGSPTSPWSVTISPLSSAGSVEINNFNAATAGVSNSDVPEVGTLFLIGMGLIAMRWVRRVPRRFLRTPQPA